MSKYDFSKHAKLSILFRDNNACVYCDARTWLTYAHFIPRSKGGKGIEENGVLLCTRCHHAYDNGKDSELADKIHKHIEGYLIKHYGSIDKRKIIDKYDKVYPRKGK